MFVCAHREASACASAPEARGCRPRSEEPAAREENTPAPVGSEEAEKRSHSVNNVHHKSFFWWKKIKASFPSRLFISYFSLVTIMITWLQRQVSN